MTDLVRVCEPTYSADHLQAESIRVHDWPFEDGSAPPAEVIEKWFQLLRDTFSNDQLPEPCVSVHCVAGLGRAPVLVALALMELGMRYEDAIEEIRKKRRGAINSKQLAFLASYRAKQRLKDDRASLRKKKCVLQWIAVHLLHFCKVNQTRLVSLHRLYIYNRFRSFASIDLIEFSNRSNTPPLSQFDDQPGLNVLVSIKPCCTTFVSLSSFLCTLLSLANHDRSVLQSLLSHFIVVLIAFSFIMHNFKWRPQITAKLPCNTLMMIKMLRMMIMLMITFLPLFSIVINTTSVMTCSHKKRNSDFAHFLNTIFFVFMCNFYSSFRIALKLI